MVRIHTVSPFASSSLSPVAHFAPARRRLFRRAATPVTLGSELESIVDHLFGGLGSTEESSEKAETPSYAPRVSLSESKLAYEVQAELPGVAKEDIELDIEDDVLEIRGQRKAADVSADEELKVHGSELSRGSFSRKIRLSQEVDADAAEAKLKDGVLTIRLPKRPEATPTRIAIGEA